MKDILNIPYVPLTIDDYKEDDGDDDHMQIFVSLSDDEQTVARKQQQAHSNFEQRVRKKWDKNKPKTLFKRYLTVFDCVFVQNKIYSN